MKITEIGKGRNILVLHGGGGPATMAGLASRLAEKGRVLVPTHPGFDGTPRPEAMTCVADLADAYVAMLEERDLRDVLLVGSSMGGWLGAEIALRAAGNRVRALVVIDGLGVDVPGQTILNVSGYAPGDLAKVAFHDPSNFGKGAPPPTPERLATMRANAATLAIFAGDTYSYDPSLRMRLGALRVPTLVVWGASDRIVTPDYGRGFAAAIPHATFEAIANAGHMPWLENPADTFAALERFVAALS